jgi:flagellar basal-body rod protein FlgF
LPAPRKTAAASSIPKAANACKLIIYQSFTHKSHLARPVQCCLYEMPHGADKGKNMENSLYVGLSRQNVLSHQMDVIANNIANVNTPGYRGQNLSFKEMVSKPRGADYATSYVYDKQQYQNTDAGPVEFTGNQLDIALEGPGFIGVSTPSGTAYTRAGNFQMSATGELLTSAGYAVAGSGGGPISIPAGSTEIKIDEKGIISNQDGAVGQLMVSEFSNPQALQPSGNNLYTINEAGQPATDTRVKQGQLEGSNVKPVVEMTRMVDTLRTFQAVQNILQTENERIRTAIQKLTRQA